MVSGFDKYFQIAKCFRDEDLRANRQPEFTQIDMELSFVDMEDVIEINERLIQKIFKEVANVDVKLPIERMPYEEAMSKYGTDKPDLRFGMEINDITDVVKNSEFKVFKDAVEISGSVRAIKVPNSADMGRKQIDKLESLLKHIKLRDLLG
jgi:aspartyl-tRNA synthetase